VHQQVARAAGDWRADLAVIEIELGSFRSRKIGVHGRAAAFDGRLVSAGRLPQAVQIGLHLLALFARRYAVFTQRIVAGRQHFGVLHLSVVFP
jgi:hypothetical protein